MEVKPTYIDIDSISGIHDFYRCGPPRHPLITVIDLTAVNPERATSDNVFYRTSLYTIMCKRFEGTMKYGRSYYDFQEGSLMFTAPNQAIAPSADLKITEGWGLFFHPDLLAGTPLMRKIHEYSFFRYDVNEALHLSDEEKQTLTDCLSKIQREYTQNIDRHSKGLITDNLHLLLNYCSRFYDRQFYTRETVNHDLVQHFEQLLTSCFSEKNLSETGIPDVKYFASRLHLSPDYLTDLLGRYTGKTTQEHIHLQIIYRAKELLSSTNMAISEIAYELGFEHPSHFTKLFTSKAGLSPRAFRNK